jgi:hypothetical protein
VQTVLCRYASAPTVQENTSTGVADSSGNHFRAVAGVVVAAFALLLF